MNEGVLMGNH